MGRFRKKPVVIEARQLTESMTDGEALDLSRWCDGSYELDGDGSIQIHTPEGTMTAVDGDWIIRGVQGEFYPCKPDIFEATYEPVEVS